MVRGGSMYTTDIYVCCNTDQALISRFVDRLARLKEVVEKMVVGHIQWVCHACGRYIVNSTKQQKTVIPFSSVFKSYYPSQQEFQALRTVIQLSKKKKQKKTTHVTDEQEKFQHVFAISLLS